MNASAFLQAGSSAAFAASLTHPEIRIWPYAHGFIASCRDGYQDAKREGESILSIARNPYKTAVSLIAGAAGHNRVHVRFIAILKLPFKFYGP